MWLKFVAYYISVFVCKTSELEYSALFTLVLGSPRAFPVACSYWFLWGGAAHLVGQAGLPVRRPALAVLALSLHCKSLQCAGWVTQIVWFILHNMSRCSFYNPSFKIMKLNLRWLGTCLMLQSDWVAMSGSNGLCVFRAHGFFSLYDWHSYISRPSWKSIKILTSIKELCPSVLTLEGDASS